MEKTGLIIGILVLIIVVVIIAYNNYQTWKSKRERNVGSGEYIHDMYSKGHSDGKPGEVNEPDKTIPTGLELNQPTAGDKIIIGWNTVPGATGYILERMPEWVGGGWMNTFKILYRGPDNNFEDNIQVEGPMDDIKEITYRICSVNGSINNRQSFPKVIKWTKAN
jgi:hypothetical protein